MTTLHVSAQQQLRQFIEQIERLEEEKKQIASDIRDKCLEAKAVGFDVKAMRQIIKMRKKSKSERDEEESILDVYMHALGMLGELADTPLGEASLDRQFPSGEAAEAYRARLAAAEAKGASMMMSPDGINVWSTDVVRSVVGDPSAEQKAAAAEQVVGARE